MGVNFDFLDSEEFYNLMQDYRNAPIGIQIFVVEAYKEVSKYIKSEILKQIIDEDRRCEDFSDID